MCKALLSRPGNVTGHGQIYGMVDVVSVQGDTNIAGTSPVSGGEAVFCLQGSNEAVNIGFLGILHPKVINRPTKVNMRSLLRPVHNPGGVIGHGKYPWGARNCSSCSLASLLAWGNPYIPRRISM